ncbi:MAG TPA: sulfurtransferase [Streptosporangiaceae bacterium]
MSDFLADPAALAVSLAGDRPPVVLDVRWRLAGPPGIESYRAGHVPLAVFVDLDRDLSGAAGPGGRHPLPSPASFQAAMRAAGVRDGYPVVVYDDGDSVPAARAWWLLRYFGHDRVRVLDGGFRAWADSGLEVTAADVAPAPGDSAGWRGDDPPYPPFVARPGGMPVVDASGAAALARDGVLIDVRTPERYRGKHEPVDPVAGHIPGAVNVPITETGNADGTFKAPAELAKLFASVSAGGGGPGASGSGAVGAYCGSGVTAARGVLALALAGIPAALYVGSWSNWITDPSRPVAP